MTPSQYAFKVAAVSPGLFVCLWLEQELLQQWIAVTPVSHPLVYFAIGVPTTMLYLSHTDILDAQ